MPLWYMERLIARLRRAYSIGDKVAIATLETALRVQRTIVQPPYVAHLRG